MRRICCSLYLLIACIPVFGQLANTTKLVGNVGDSSNAPIVGASVTAVNIASKDTYRAVTSADGLYTFEFIRIGTYNVTAEKDGFQLVTRQNVIVDANQTVRVDLTLPVGQISEHVEVVAATPPISTDDASVKEIIAQKSISDLPLNGRDPLQLAITTPGVILGPKSSNTGIPPGEDFIGAGSREIQNSISLDGISLVKISSRWLRSIPQSIPSKNLRCRPEPTRLNTVHIWGRT